MVHLEKVNIPSTTDLINILTKKGGLTRQLRISQMIKEKEKGSLKTLSQTMEEKGSQGAMVVKDSVEATANKAKEGTICVVEDLAKAGINKEEEEATHDKGNNKGILVEDIANNGNDGQEILKFNFFVECLAKF